MSVNFLNGPKVEVVQGEQMLRGKFQSAMCQKITDLVRNCIFNLGTAF